MFEFVLWGAYGRTITISCGFLLVQLMRCFVAALPTVVMTFWLLATVPGRSRAFVIHQRWLSTTASISRLNHINSDYKRFTYHELTAPRQMSTRRRASDGIDSAPDGNNGNSNSTMFKRGQAIKFTIQRFGPLGASVTIEGSASTGLVLQNKIALFRESRDGEDVLVGETLDGYIERIREDGKLDVSIRPLGSSRISPVKQLILDAIEGSPSESIPIGDKSSPAEISAYIHGITKTDFKQAVGSLYKDGIVKPGAYETTLIPEDERKASAIIGVASANASKGKDDLSRKVFIGNLPNRITKEAALKALKDQMGKDDQGNEKVVTVRLSLDENKRPRGFGYVELTSEQYLEEAVELLQGMEIGGRIIRADYADPTRRTSPSTSTSTGTSTNTRASTSAGSSASRSSNTGSGGAPGALKAWQRTSPQSSTSGSPPSSRGGRYESPRYEPPSSQATDDSDGSSARRERTDTNRNDDDDGDDDDDMSDSTRSLPPGRYATPSAPPAIKSWSKDPSAPSTAPKSWAKDAMAGSSNSHRSSRDADAYGANRWGRIATVVVVVVVVVLLLLLLLLFCCCCSVAVVLLLLLLCCCSVVVLLCCVVRAQMCACFCSTFYF